MSIVALKGVSRTYESGGRKVYALNKVSFTVEEGEFTVILGPSGAGKSTLLNILGGIDHADEGEVRISGLDMAALNEKEISGYRAEKVGFVFQFYNLIPTLTVRENVALMQELKRMSRLRMRRLKSRPRRPRGQIPGPAVRRRTAEGIYREGDSQEFRLAAL